MPTWVVELYGGCALARAFELLDAGFEQRDVLLEKTRSRNLGSRSVLAVVGTVVSDASTTGWLIAVASLSDS